MADRDIYSLLTSAEELEDDDDDLDFDYFVADDEVDEVIEDEDEDDDEEMGDEFYDPDELDDEEDDDEDDDGEAGGGRLLFRVDGNDDGGDGEGTTFLELASLLNARGTSAEARSSILARLLAGAGAGVARQQSARRAPTTRATQEAWWTPQKEPHPKGQALLRGGEFGAVGGGCARVATAPAPAPARSHVRGRRGMLGRDRGLGGGVPLRKGSVATIPNTNGTVVAHYPSIPYVGQYAKEDYSLFFTATQYYTIHLYDVSAQRSYTRRPARTAGAGTGAEGDEEGDDGIAWGSWGTARGLRGAGMGDDDTSLKKIKTVQGEEGRWTVTDCDSTRDGERMIYSSITPYVHMLRTSEHEAEHTCLDFTGARRRGHGYDGWQYDGFGIWSIRFSADGNEVVAGAGSGKLLVYDIEAERRTLSITGHADDVNAVCFVDESSTNILVSGSDDGYVKIWDRRSLSGGTPSGVLVGATEGITYTSPKGDGRYIVVNSKDQAARLYDLRKMKSWNDFSTEPDAVAKYGQVRYDYRNSHYPTPPRLAHPKDCSVMTYRGHAVLRTLIRCHFSPRESTGQGYIYSGSADGMIHIWSLDGRVVQVLDRSQSIPLRNEGGEYSDPSAPEQDAPRRQRRGIYGRHDYCTRDVSWHGYEPSLMSTSWEVDGSTRRGGSIAKHEWKGLGKGGLDRLEDWVERERLNEMS